jgi:hypothetical protein
MRSREPVTVETPDITDSRPVRVCSAVEVALSRNEESRVIGLDSSRWSPKDCRK